MTSCLGYIKGHEKEYVYLLGFYLGDGCISKHPRCRRLCIYIHSDHKELAQECINAIKSVLPSNRVSSYKRKDMRCVEDVKFLESFLGPKA